MAGEITEDREPQSFLCLKVGHYRVTREIGRGGMGVVCLAVHEQIGQRAAIKILLPTWRSDSRTAQRFLTEARTASKVQHPGLVKIFDFGRLPDGAPYILMEYLEGELLRARLQQTRERQQEGLPFNEALHIVRQLALALQSLHEERIVHRDLKPENVMLIRDAETASGERAKLLDFGIAKFTEDGPGISAERSIIGTALYMSPEQCSGEAGIDGKSDVYALGVMLYELLSGATPFQGAPADVMEQHIFTDPPPLRLREAGAESVAIEDLLRRMLRKVPSRRPTMREVAEAIQRLSPRTTADRAPPASEPRRGPSRRLWIGIGLSLAACAGGAMLWRAHGILSAEEPAAVLSGMVWIQGRSFLMGSTPAEVEHECRLIGSDCPRAALERELPARQVTVSSFYLDTREVTNRDFAVFLNQRMFVEVREDKEHALPRFVHDREKDALLVDLWPEQSGLTRDDKGLFVAKKGHELWPVTLVTWEAASLYCRTQGKRLPTEAEWELAARGGTRRRFPWGDDAPRCPDVAFGRASDEACAARSGCLQEVGTATQDRTPEGVFDLGGNVSEWVQDQFRLPYYPPCGACKDPLIEAAVPPQEDTRVYRGGACPAPSDVARAAARGRWSRQRALYGLGFRCASR